MKFQGFIIKPESGRLWPVEVPCLGIHTQEKSKNDAYAMAKDAIETIVERPGFSVDIVPDKEGLGFAIVPNDPAPIVAAILKRLRQQRGLTVREMAKRIGSKSPNSYAQYENGRAIPSLSKLSQLLTAIDPQYEPVFPALFLSKNEGPRRDTPGRKTDSQTRA